MVVIVHIFRFQVILSFPPLHYCHLQGEDLSAHSCLYGEDSGHDEDRQLGRDDEVSDESSPSSLNWMNNISTCQLVEGIFLYQTIARPFWFSWDMILLSSSSYLLAISLFILDHDAVHEEMMARLEKVRNWIQFPFINKHIAILFQVIVALYSYCLHRQCQHSYHIYFQDPLQV